MLYQRCNVFLNALASAKPVPGGGGASALVAAEGVALGEMVGNLTLGRQKYAEVEEEIKGLLDKLGAFRNRFEEMVNADARAFEPLQAAYGMPAETEEEKAKKEAVMESCLYDAAMSPFKIGETVNKALQVMRRMGEIGTKIAISDVATGVGFLVAAARGAYINVLVNTSLMKNEKTKNIFEENAEKWLKEAVRTGEEIISDIVNRMVSK